MHTHRSGLHAQLHTQRTHAGTNKTTKVARMHTHALTHACTHMHRKGRSHAHTRTGTCMHTHAQTQKPVRMRTQRPAHTHGRPASAPRIWAPRFSAASASTLDHVNCPPYNLGAKIHGAETCYLGAMVHGAELGVYFLKSFQKGCTYENLSTKGLKNKKVGRGRGWSRY
jgi:hypothetical protein